MTGALEMAPRNIIDACESTVLLFRSELSTLDFFTVLGQNDECCEKKIYKKRSCSCDQSGSLTGIVSALSTHFETFSTSERQCKYIVGYVYLIST